MRIKNGDVENDDVEDRDHATLIPDACRLVLAQIPILPRRMLLQTESIMATAPMLRGVWGAALHHLDLNVYHTVFDVANQKGPAIPGYIIRPAPEDPTFAPAVDWFLIGDAIRHDRTLVRAWDIACGMGLGRDRHPFLIPETVTLSADGRHGTTDGCWRLDRARWPLPDAARSPCRLVFSAPLRLRRRGKLIERPTLSDIVVASGRRVGAFLPRHYQGVWEILSSQMLEISRTIPCAEWKGARLDLIRYSGRQHQELDIHGVSGSLLLPEGPSILWPLLAAANWLHIGKGTIMGLGQMHVHSA